MVLSHCGGLVEEPTVHAFENYPADLTVPNHTTRVAMYACSQLRAADLGMTLKT